MEKVKWGIIGVGDVCEVKSGPAFQKAKNSELVAVMRRTGEKAKDFAERHGVPKWYDKAEDLITDPDINAIYIATPPVGHESYTKMAAAAGKPVYVEKPMARTHQECLNMIEACDNAQVPLFVAYYRRALPNFLKVKELLKEGVIGDVRFIDVKVHKTNIGDVLAEGGNWRTDPETAGGGYFFDLASHQFDFLDYLFGPVIDASGFARNSGGLYKAEDTVVGNFHFVNGVIGLGSWCFAVNKKSEIERTTIYGSEGRIEFSFFEDSLVYLHINGHRPKRYSFDMPKHIQQPLIETIVQDLVNGTSKCPSTGVSAARTNKVLEQICQRVDLL
ncbi:Gfo/Idh/MocA family protein [Jiulongibacter sp. NS-SX5]|uniref:Gfo/Idh/MocA family protein n=1 Tax=Jiulongibacter sp. NS-SX5 TaxID=3463854 RepID=UPI004057DCE2